MECACCEIPMQSLGQIPIRTGGASGGGQLLLGQLAEGGEGTLPLHAYRCRRCKRVELFDLDMSLPER